MNDRIGVHVPQRYAPSCVGTDEAPHPMRDRQLAAVTEAGELWHCPVCSTDLYAPAPRFTATGWLTANRKGLPFTSLRFPG